MINRIVKSAVEAYLHKNVDPNVVVMAWANRAQPSLAELKKVAVEINKELYRQAIINNKPGKLPLINIEKLASSLKYLIEDNEKRQNSDLDLAVESGLINPFPGIDSFEDAFRLHEFETFLDNMRKEAEAKLKQEDATPLKTKIKVFLVKKFKPMYEHVKTAAALYVGRVDSMIDSIAEDLYKLHVDDRISRKSLVKLASDFIQDEELLKRVLFEFNKKILQLRKEASIPRFEKGFVEIDGKRYLFNVRSSIVGKINDLKSIFNANLYYRSNDLLSKAPPYDTDTVSLVHYIDGFPDEKLIDYTPIINAVKQIAAIWEDLKKVGMV